MAFWNKKGADEGGEGAITSIISQDMQLIGNLSFNGKLRLDGRIKVSVHRGR